MATAYGKIGKVVTGLCALFLCTGIVGAQVGAIGIVFNVFYGLDRSVGIAIGCGIVILYTTFGGMRAVVFTDLVQFAILAIGMPLVLVFGINYVGGIDALIAAIPRDRIAIPGGYYAWPGLVALFLVFMFGETLVLMSRGCAPAGRRRMLHAAPCIPACSRFRSSPSPE
jgi:SSS family solute:Na+ symporter